MCNSSPTRRLSNLVNQKGIFQDTSDLEFYVVGGAVRDVLLGREPKDLDFVVVGTTPKEMIDKGFQPIDADFPVFLDDENDEWALARTEKKNGKGYKGFDTRFTPDVTLEEDLRRRDFTINGMAFNPKDKTIKDPHNGISDIQYGVVRHISEAYAEDPLRIIRFARFVSRFDFEPHPSTVQLSRKIVHELKHILNERIFLELKKSMKQADEPSKFFETLKETNALLEIFPELRGADEIPAGPDEYHNDKTVWEHTLEVVDRVHELDENNPKLLLSAFFHDIGKCRTDDSVLPHHYRHEIKGKEMFDDISDRLKFSNSYSRIISNCIENHIRIKRLFDMNESKAIRFVENVDKIDDELIDYLITLLRADEYSKEIDRDIDESKFKKYIDEIREVVDDIRGDIVVDNYPEKEGQEIYDLLTQFRTEELRKRMNP